MNIPGLDHCLTPNEICKLIIHHDVNNLYRNVSQYINFVFNVNDKVDI